MEELSEQFPDQDRAPTEERRGQQQVRKGFVTSALPVEDPGDDSKHEGHAKLRRDSDLVQIIGGPTTMRKLPPSAAVAGGPTARRLVYTWAVLKNSQRRRSLAKQPFINRGLPRCDHNPGFEGGAEVVQSEQASTLSAPKRLGMPGRRQAVHVGEETRSQCRGGQQSDRNNAFRSHQFKCAARDAIRKSLSIRMKLSATKGEEIRFRPSNPRRLSSPENAPTGDRYTTPSPENSHFRDYKGRISKRSRVRGYQSGTRYVRDRTHHFLTGN